MVDDYEKVKTIVNRYGGKHDSVIAILQDVQSKYHYLPEHALRAVAVQLDLPLIQICGVATFFKAFSLEPRGEHTVTVCLGTACHVRGAPAVLDEVKRQLGIEPGNTTDDMRFTSETVNCLGACALGPILVVDGEYHGQMSSRKVKKVLSKYRKTPKDGKHEEITVSS
ncbi:NAD(P)H-dependent oxidoreductase subunit E [Candidatus Bathyarchaeota archaeon]|nr:NAD(P)H-dependent oxidoreductase subunit E [Candidatus Bathyarchaeota archaeon]